MIATTQQIKETGVTFTPILLANYLSKKLLSYLKPNGQKINVLDSACGEGALLGRHIDGDPGWYIMDLITF